MERLVGAVIAVVVGAGGGILLYVLLNAAAERLPHRAGRILRPYVFVGPAVLIVGLLLILPAARSVYLSFLNADSTELVGLANYQALFTDPAILGAITNNLLWILIVPASCVGIGLLVAVLADTLTARWESIAKSIVFLPMAISFVGAATIWRFVYEYRPEGRPQIGLLNEVWTQLGGAPVAWLQDTAINDLMLMVAFVWLQAGFSMVLLSAAIKNVPTEVIEAARVDGASEMQLFFRIIVPQIHSTIAVVFTTVLIGVLKVFDIVKVMTNGNFGTEVIANRFVTEIFTFREYGRAAAVVTFLMVAIVPIMIINIRRFHVQEAVR